MPQDNRLADLATRKMLDEYQQAQMYAQPQPDASLASLIDRGGNFIRNDQTGRVIELGPSQPVAPRFAGSPVDVFGQGRGYLDPTSGIIRGINKQGQQFTVQDEGMQADAMKKKLQQLQLAKAERDLSGDQWETKDSSQGMVQINKQTGEVRKLGIESAAQSKPMTADQEAKYRQKFGEAYGTTINALQSAQNVTKLAEELKTHPGLGGITGLSGYSPDYPGGDAAGARQKFETLQGKITKMAKDAAASSGSIGPMAVQEWKILRDQIAAIDPTKLSEKQLQDVLDELVIQAKNAASITEEAYASTFSPDFDKYPQFANPRGGMPMDGTSPGGQVKFLGFE